MLLISAYFVIAQGTDTDNDGMDDDWELAHGLDNETDDTLEDPDEDGLINIQEYILGCHPQENDTDEDGHNDWKEFQYQTNCSNKDNYPNASLINVSLITPKYGVAKISTFNFSIQTSNKSHCKFHSSNQENYSDIDLESNWFNTTNGYIHNIPERILNLPDNTIATHYIYCKADDSGYENNEFPVPIDLSVDRTEPVIEKAYADPPKVIEKLEVDLIAETDDLTICRFDMQGHVEQDPNEYYAWFDNHDKSEFKKTHTVTYTKNTNPKIEDGKNYTFYVNCMNLAGWYLPQIIPINFSVDLSAANLITKLSPSGYISDKDIEVRVETNKNTDCKFGEGYPNDFPQGNSKIHYYEEQNLDEGNYSIPVMCIFADWSTVEDVIKFTVDLQKPTNTIISADTSTCNNESLKANFSATDNIGIAGYYYRLLDSSGDEIINYRFTNKSAVVLENLSLKRLERYVWEVKPTDLAGNNASLTKKSSPITILSDTNTLCIENQLPYVNVSAVLTESDVKLTLLCKDDDGLCSKREYFIYDIDKECGVCSDCYKEYLTASTISITEDSKLCYKMTDNDNATTEDFFTVKFENCTTSPNCCLGREAYVCNLNCSVVSNVVCDPEKVDSDNDGIPDLKEDECNLNANDGTDANLDDDGDGLTNKEECLTYGTDIDKKDTDGDGYTDKEEIDGDSNPNNNRDYPDNGDLDNDGITESREKSCGLDRTKNDADDDNDGDGLTNYEECVKYRSYNIDPNIKDTDGDGHTDKVEIDKGTDPDNSADFPKSYVLNIISFILGFGFIIGGIVVFSQDKPSFKMPKLTKAEIKKPIVNFKDAKKQMQQQAQHTAVQKTVAWPRKNIDIELLRKREMLKMKKMSSIFDEFAEDKDEEKEHPAYKKLDKLPKNKKNKSKKDVFKELDEIAEKDKK